MSFLWQWILQHALCYEMKTTISTFLRFCPVSPQLSTCGTTSTSPTYQWRHIRNPGLQVCKDQHFINSIFKVLPVYCWSGHSLIKWSNSLKQNLKNLQIRTQSGQTMTNQKRCTRNPFAAVLRLLSTLAWLKWPYTKCHTDLDTAFWR